MIRNTAEQLASGQPERLNFSSVETELCIRAIRHVVVTGQVDVVRDPYPVVNAALDGPDAAITAMTRHRNAILRNIDLAAKFALHEAQPTESVAFLPRNMRDTGDALYFFAQDMRRAIVAFDGGEQITLDPADGSKARRALVSNFYAAQVLYAELGAVASARSDMTWPIWVAQSLTQEAEVR